MKGISNGINQHKNRICDSYNIDDNFPTRAILVGHNPSQWQSGIVIPPIHLGTTFIQDGPGKHMGSDNGRCGNPTRHSLEACIASLDKAKYCLTFSSGIATVTGIAALLKPGDHIICGDDVYGGTSSYFRNNSLNRGLEVDFIDTTIIENVQNAIKSNTKLIWVESPTNPLLKIMDIPNLASAIKSKSKDVMFVVDNTFLTPYLQKPLSVGADLVAYSLTKYMNGHSDVIMGAITTDNEKWYNQLSSIQKSMGLIPSPFDCYLVSRSLKTLSVRMDKHIRNAMQVARFLEKHPLVERVIYPGLKSHPQHTLANSLWNGPSGMISFYIKGDLRRSTAFLKDLKIFHLAVSLGGFESLAELPSFMTHALVPEKVRKQLGVTDTLIRLSIGLESVMDLIKDLDQALNAVATTF